jgi:hypothetical protein
MPDRVPSPPSSAKSCNVATMASRRRRALRLGGVLGFAAALVLAGCGNSSDTRRALDTARDELGHIHAEDLGHLLGHGSYGSTGISGGPPTAFVAVQTEIPTDSLMSTIGARMQQAGFTPFVSCRPPLPCIWEKRANKPVITATVVVKTEGAPWGEKSTAHGTVSAGRRVLELEMVVGG